MAIKAILLLLTISSFNLAQQNETWVGHFTNTMDKQYYSSLKLDDTHPNLLDPSASELDQAIVYEAWTDIHQNIQSYLSHSKFNWNTSSSSVKIYQKIYFHSNGKAKAHFFRIQGDDISLETKEALKVQLKAFWNQYQIDIKRSGPFAQCGKIKYMLNEKSN